MAHHGADRTAVDVREVDAGLLNRSVAVAVPAQGDVVRGPGGAVVGVDLVHSPSAAGPGSRRTRALRLTSGSGGRRNVHTVGAQETDEGAGKTKRDRGDHSCMRARGTRISEHRTRNDRILLPGAFVVVEPGPHAGQWGTAWGTPTAAAGGTNRTGSVQCDPVPGAEARPDSAISSRVVTPRGRGSSRRRAANARTASSRNASSSRNRASRSPAAASKARRRRYSPMRC